MATESNSQPVMVGPCGGSGGSTKEITLEPRHLQSIIIRSGDAVDSIEFSYIDHAGHPRSAGPWGGSGGNPDVINLADNEFVKEVSGTFREFQGDTVVIALEIVTNQTTYGPYGKMEGAPFSLPVQPGSAIVGMFARSGTMLDAIGVYVRHI